MRSLICAPALFLVASCAVSQPTGPVTTPSGLVYQSLKEGSGTPPAAMDTVKVHYRGTLADGREFDSSYKRGEPAEFPLNRVIRCWTEGVQLMKPGGKARLGNLPYVMFQFVHAPIVAKPKE